MPRQSISLTDPNDRWLKEQLEAQEFSSKSEAINALVRKARRNDEYREYVRDKLKASEERTQKEGYYSKTPQDLLKDIKAQARKDGLL